MIFQSLNYAFEYFKWYIFSLTSPRGTKLVVQYFYFLIWHAVNTFHCHRTDGHPEQLSTNNMLQKLQKLSSNLWL